MRRLSPWSLANIPLIDFQQIPSKYDTLTHISIISALNHLCDIIHQFDNPDIVPHLWHISWDSKSSNPSLTKSAKYCSKPTISLSQTYIASHSLFTSISKSLSSQKHCHFLSLSRYYWAAHTIECIIRRRPCSPRCRHLWSTECRTNHLGLLCYSRNTCLCCFAAFYASKLMGFVMWYYSALWGSHNCFGYFSFFFSHKKPPK